MNTLGRKGNVKVSSNNLSYIYDELTDEVNSLVQSMETNTGDLVLDSATKVAKDTLSKLSTDISVEYSELKKNTTWDRYTIAFYGETNAGKSAIIETLRILCNEKKKTEERDKFSEILQSHNLDVEHVAEIQAEYEKRRTELKNVEQKFEQLKVIEFQQTSPFVAEIDSLNLQIEDERARMNFWKKLIKFLLMQKSILETKMEEQQNELSKIEKDFNEKKKVIRTEVDKAKISVNEIEKANTEITSVLANLGKYADGAIIGTGISDFTRHSSIYTFNLNGVEFDLIDVPGIEGNEKIVKKSIHEAVQKAHAVFYVTRKAAAPQTGDGYEGTLEKIKKHLGAQTQVWAIFNQSVTNPIRLSRDMVSEDEKKSLQDMDQKLKEVLGVEHYCGNIILSAYPAFLAVANHLVPNSKYHKSRTAFLSKFDKKEILDRSQFTEFLRKLPGDVVGDWRKRIIESNLNKAKVVLEKANAVVGYQIDKFNDVSRKLHGNAVNFNSQLELELVSFERNLRNKIDDNFENAVSNIRKEMYQKIDGNDLDNSNLKNNLFKQCVEYNVKKFQDKTEGNIREYGEKFAKSLYDMARNYLSIVRDYFDSKYLSIKKVNVDFSDIINSGDIKSGIKWKDLIGGIGSIIAILIADLEGWGLVVTAALAIFELWQAFREFFSLEYKRKRQKEYVEKCLFKMRKDVDKKINEDVTKVVLSIKDQSVGFREQFNRIAQLADLINKNLLSGQCEIARLMDNLKEEKFYA